MRRAARVTGILLQGFVVAACLGVAAFFLVPRLMGWRVVTVMSGSMAPAYPVDAVLAVDPVDPANVRTGDVIAFQLEADRPVVTHRVVEVQRDADGLSFVTKGDANEDADRDPVPATAVRGRVAFGIPHLGVFVRIVQTPLGFAALFALPGLLLIGQEVGAIRRERRRIHLAATPPTAVACMRPYEPVESPRCPWPAPSATGLVSLPTFDVWSSTVIRRGADAGFDREAYR